MRHRYTGTSRKHRLRLNIYKVTHRIMYLHYHSGQLSSFPIQPPSMLTLLFCLSGSGLLSMFLLQGRSPTIVGTSHRVPVVNSQTARAEVILNPLRLEHGHECACAEA